MIKLGKKKKKMKVGKMVKEVEVLAAKSDGPSSIPGPTW